MIEKSKNNQKGFLVPLAIIVGMVIVGGGVYFYLYSQNQEARLKTALVTAKAIQATETETLQSLEQKFAAAYPLHALVQEQYSNMRSLIQSTNFFFTHSDSLNPQIAIKTKNSAIKIDIENRRAKISTLLNEWKEKAAKSLTEKVNTETIKSIKEDAKIIDAFVNQLLIIVNALTPANSGLSQSEIAEYASVVTEATNQIDNVIIALEGAPLGEEAPTTIQNTEETNTSNNTETTSTPQEMQEEIEAQEAVVEEAEANVEAIEEELEEISSPNENEESNEEDSSTEEDVSNEETESEETPDSGSEEDEASPTEPITITPGTPQLIQGANRD